jgi:hypothetical protein
MRDMGVDVLRLSPQAEHMVDVVQLFHGVMHGELVVRHAYERLLPLMPAAACNGYWHGRPGLELVEA